MAEGRRTSEIAGDDVGLFGERRVSVRADEQDSNRDERPRRVREPNTRMDSEDITAKMLVRLKKSRSGHQGHLTSLANKISALLIDTSHVREVKELSQLYDRQWERFELVHSEILACAGHDTLARDNAVQVYNELSHKKLELLDKISQYVQVAEASWDDNRTVRENLNTIDKISDKSDQGSIRSAGSSTRSVEARLKREKAELSLKQLRECQFIEKENEQRMLELRQNLEQQTLKNKVELAILEEKHAIEYEQDLFSDDESIRSDAQTGFK